MKILDIILLNESFYKKLSDKKQTLNIGIILIGIINMSIPIIENFNRLFINKDSAIFFYNITLSILYMLLAGFVYALFFSFPLFDLFKHFKRERNLELSGFLTRLMKIYIVANFLILPASIIMYIATNKINYQANSAFDYISTLLVFLIMVWFAAVVSRGLNAICGFHPGFRKIIFVVIFVWNYVLEIVLGYIIVNWAMHVFR